MPTLSQREFEALLADRSKRIVGDLAWSDDPDHLPAQEVRAGIESDSGWPILAYGWWQPRYEKLSFALIHRTEGRIFGFDLGSGPHRSPDGTSVRGTHQHVWTAEHRDGIAIARPDIVLSWAQPSALWQIFCLEAGIDHIGRFAEPILSIEGI